MGIYTTEQASKRLCARAEGRLMLASFLMNFQPKRIVANKNGQNMSDSAISILKIIRNFYDIRFHSSDVFSWYWFCSQFAAHGNELISAMSHVADWKDNKSGKRVMPSNLFTI